MTLQEVAQLCINLHVYSKDTEDTMLRVARLFEARSGVTHLHDIDTQALLRFKRETLRVANTITFNGYLKYLKKLGKFAKQEGIVKKNPFKRQRAAPKICSPYKVVEPEVFIEAFRYLTDYPDQFKPTWFWKIVIRTLYYTGIRRRQLVSIQVEDLNFTYQALKASVRGSKTHREWYIPLHPAIVPDLQRLLAFSAQALGRPLQPQDYVFVVQRFNKRYALNKDNPDQMKREQVTGFFKRLSGKIEQRIGAHRLRHTTATQLCNPVDRAPDLFAAQELLGHVELNTTRSYVHTHLNRIRTEVEALPAVEQQKNT